MKYSYKMFFFTLIICSLALFGYSFAATHGQPGASCQTQEDCLPPTCPGCGSLCLNNKCTFVQCKDHGSYDAKRQKCVCMQGYTGKYCETHVSSLPKGRPKSKTASSTPVGIDAPLMWAQRVVQPLGSCQTVADCPPPECPACEMRCEYNLCFSHQCMDHGQYDFDMKQCICDDGYRGNYCEQEVPKKPKDYCENDQDCPVLRCANKCGLICRENRCVKVQCEDHGYLDSHIMKCVCNPGWTGRYCEQQIANIPAGRANGETPPAIIKPANAPISTNKQEKCYYASTQKLQWVRYYNDQQEIIAALFYCPDGRLNGKYLKNAKGEETKLCGKNLEPSLPCGVSIHMELDRPCDPQGKGLFCEDNF